MVTGLYASTFRTQGEDVEASILIHLAESRMGELRAEASNFGTYDNLDSESGSVNSTDYPSYVVETFIETIPVQYPCDGLASLTYADSYKRAVVKVTAPSGANLKLSTLIGCPSQEVDELRVTQTSGATVLAQRDRADFLAELVDTSGANIEDIQFRFYVDFRNGNGHLEEQPDGTTAAFFNEIRNPDGTFIFTGGTAALVGRAIYAGQEYRGVSDTFNLTP